MTIANCELRIADCGLRIEESIKAQGATPKVEFIFAIGNSSSLPCALCLLHPVYLASWIFPSVSCLLTPCF